MCWFWWLPRGRGGSGCAGAGAGASPGGAAVPAPAAAALSVSVGDSVGEPAADNTHVQLHTGVFLFKCLSRSDKTQFVGNLLRLCM